MQPEMRKRRARGRAPRTSGAASRLASNPQAMRQTVWASMSVPDAQDADRTEPTQIARAVREAANDWAEAMRAHKLAPPDAGFAGRLRSLAQAAAREHTAWQNAHTAGLMWRPVPGAERAQPPYELRPGTGRRGPQQLWERFDVAVATLNAAITGSDAAAVAAAFGELAAAAGALADAVARGDAAKTQQDRAQMLGAA